jgi:hypothetical protein
LTNKDESVFLVFRGFNSWNKLLQVFLLSRKQEGGGVVLEGAKGEKVHIGQETSQKRKLCHDQ